MAIAALAATTPAASAQDAGSLIIAVSTCPHGYDGDDFAADCATPAVGVNFSIGTPNTGNVESSTSRADGLVTFSLAPDDLNPTAPDTVTVGEPAAQALDYAVFCTDATAGEPLDFAYETTDSAPGGPLLGIRFEFETGDQIACEWYNIPQPMNPGDDDDDDVGQLPNTGVGTSAADADGRAGFAGFALLGTLVGGAALGRRRFVESRVESRESRVERR